MAPSKAPAFAVCGGLSVETVVTGVGRRKSSGKVARRAVAGLAESLYADLLWDCGGANVVNSTAAGGTASPSQATSDDDFADVFGGPPQFSSLSSQLSFRRDMTRVSDACSNEAFLIRSSLGMPFDPSVFDASTCQARSRISRETFENLTASPSSAKSVKLRSTTEAEFSSRICYSDSDNRCSLQDKDDSTISRQEISSAVPAGPSSCARTTSMLMRPRESLRPEDTKDAKLSKPSKVDFPSMKENIEVCGSEHEGKLSSAQGRMQRSLKCSQEAKQKLGRFAQHSKAHRQSHSSKVKKKDKIEDFWVTIKDIKCATEPSMFPPPSRPPPKLSSDAAYAVRNTHVAESSIYDRQKSSPKRSIFDSGSVRSSSTQDSSTKATSHSRVTEDAVEIAEAKIRMVLQAREKAKSMVEKKLREKQKAQQLKEKPATDGRLGTKHEFKGHLKEWRGEKGNPRVWHQRTEVNKEEADWTMQRDIARQCIEKTTQELQSKTAAIVQERVAKIRLSHNVPERPIEVRQGHPGTISGKQTTAHSETTLRSGPFCSKTSGAPERQYFCEEKVVEEAILVSREQQQDSISSSWCSTEQKDFNEFSRLDEQDSTPSTPDLVFLSHAGDSSLMGFQEIMGETLERRMARWDRHCHTAARMAKALEEKKQRDLEHQQEQADRHRAAETLDEEIKAWAAGKEGNLEALLCSLHLVLWPECGWKVVSVVDLSTAEAVKKCYRQATLCVHPDKVQQRGATVAQKYIAEKVFDLLRESLAKYSRADWR